jgi:hypothetical protein
VSRCHSTPAPYNGSSTGGSYPPAPWQQQQQQQFGLPPRSSYPAHSYEQVPHGSNPNVTCYNGSSGGLPPLGGRHMHGSSQSYGGSNPNTYSSADPLSSLPASLLADAPATVMLQQAAAAAGASSAAGMGEMCNTGLPMGLIKDMSTAGPHYQQQHLVHAHTAPALSSLAAHSGSEQQQQRSATPPLAAWDAVGETLSTAFGDAGDDGLAWDNFDLPDLKENDVEALLML